MNRRRASLVAQMVKNLLAVQEAWVQSLGQEDPWRREWEPTPVFLPGESHGQRSLAGYSPWGFSGQEYWSRLPFSSPGIFLTQGLNVGLLRCRRVLYHLSHQGSLDFIFLRSVYFILWLCWVFVAACWFSLVAVSGGCSSLHHTGLSLWRLLSLQSNGL